MNAISASWPDGQLPLCLLRHALIINQAICSDDTKGFLESKDIIEQHRFDSVGVADMSLDG